METRLVDIKLGYSCNNNCVHCVIAGHRERLLERKRPLDRTTLGVKKLVIGAEKKGARAVTLTGGEATIRKDFFELLGFAAGRGLEVNLQTNGRAFSVPGFAEKALSIAPDLAFVVALHHARPVVHDSITRAKGSWKQTVGGIQNIKRQGGRVLLKVVLSKLNYRDLPALVNLAKRMGLDGMPVAFPHGMGNALKYWRDVVPRYSDIMPHIARAAELAEKKKVRLTYEAVPFCFLKGFEGRASEISFLQDWLEHRTMEIRQVGERGKDWQGERLSLKRKAVSCKKCRYFFVCEGAWGEYFGFYGTSEFKPVAGKRIENAAEFWEALKV